MHDLQFSSCRSLWRLPSSLCLAFVFLQLCLFFHLANFLFFVLFSLLLFFLGLTPPPFVANLFHFWHSSTQVFVNGCKQHQGWALQWTEDTHVHIFSRSVQAVEMLSGRHIWPVTASVGMFVVRCTYLYKASVLLDYISTLETYTEPDSGYFLIQIFLLWSENKTLVTKSWYLCNSSLCAFTLAINGGKELVRKGILSSVEFAQE